MWIPAEVPEISMPWSYSIGWDESLFDLFRHLIENNVFIFTDVEKCEGTYAECLNFDWNNKLPKITLNNLVICEGKYVKVPSLFVISNGAIMWYDLSSLSTKTIIESAGKLLEQVITAGFDCWSQRARNFYLRGSKVKSRCYPFTKSHYESANLAFTRPVLERRSLCDLYIYERIVNKVCWTNWNNCEEHDRVLCHKGLGPLSPFFVTLKRSCFE